MEISLNIKCSFATWKRAMEAFFICKSSTDNFSAGLLYALHPNILFSLRQYATRFGRKSRTFRHKKQFLITKPHPIHILKKQLFALSPTVLLINNHPCRIRQFFSWRKYKPVISVVWGKMSFFGFIGTTSLNNARGILFLFASSKWSRRHATNANSVILVGDVSFMPKPVVSVSKNTNDCTFSIMSADIVTVIKLLFCCCTAAIFAQRLFAQLLEI